MTRVRIRLRATCAGDGATRRVRDSATGVSAARPHTRQRAPALLVTLTARDIAALHGCSKRTAQRIIARGRAAGSLAVVEAMTAGGNGARQRCYGVEVETAGV